MSEEVKSNTLKVTGIIAGSAGIGYGVGKSVQQAAINRAANERMAINSEIQRLLEENQSLNDKYPTLLQKYKSIEAPPPLFISAKEDFELQGMFYDPQSRIENGYMQAKKLKQDFLIGLKGAQYKELQNAMKNKADINTLTPEIRGRYEAYLKYQKARNSVKQYEKARLDVINCKKTIKNNLNIITQLKDKLSGITKQCSEKGLRAGICVALITGSIAALCSLSKD